MQELFLSSWGSFSVAVVLVFFFFLKKGLDLFSKSQFLFVLIFNRDYLIIIRGVSQLIQRGIKFFLHLTVKVVYKKIFLTNRPFTTQKQSRMGSPYICNFSRPIDSLGRRRVLTMGMVTMWETNSRRNHCSQGRP